MITASGRCIAVSVAHSLYGLPVDEVQEVIGMRPLTRLFHAPEAMAGVTNLRGDVLPVVDLGLMLGSTPRVPGAAEARIVVICERGGARRRAGLCVDGLRGLRDYPSQGLAPTPQTLLDPARDLVLGILPDPPPCAVLDVSALLDAPSIAPLGRSAARD